MTSVFFSSILAKNKIAVIKTFGPRIRGGGQILCQMVEKGYNGCFSSFVHAGVILVEV